MTNQAGDTAVAASGATKPVSPKKTASKTKKTPTMKEKSTSGVATAIKKTSASSKTASHPGYIKMIVKAIEELKEKSGSSRQAITKYIGSHFAVDNDSSHFQSNLKMALKRGVASGVLQQAKGTGAAGSFRVNMEKKAKKTGIVKKKPAVKKASSTSPGRVKAKPAKSVEAKEKKAPPAKAAASSDTPKNAKKPVASKSSAGKAKKSVAAVKKTGVTKKTASSKAKSATATKSSSPKGAAPKASAKAALKVKKPVVTKKPAIKAAVKKT